MSASAPMALENRIMSFADFITATYTLKYALMCALKYALMYALKYVPMCALKYALMCALKYALLKYVPMYKSQE